MKKEILKLLRETDGYISGQQLCELFQVSRTAVWKVVDQLKKEGYVIEAVRNKGYHLVSSPDIISENELESVLRTHWIGKKIIYYGETDSTNTRAKALGEEGGIPGTLVAAGSQTAGKGRRGRMWESPEDSSIYMSILLRPSFLPPKAPMLTLVMALSVAQGINEITGLCAGIKWPNDIVINGKKICGILTEMSAEIDYINYVVTGVGINVNTGQFPGEISKTATSIANELGRPVRRAQLIGCVMEQFEKNYEVFLETEDMTALRESYNALLVNKDRDVKVLEPGNEYEAHALGINRTGELLVKTINGKENAVFAGEVSVRGIYGYI